MNVNSIVRSVMHFDVLNLTNNIVVMLYGSMTPEQKRIARRKNRIRPDKVLCAMQWLVLNHNEWRTSNIDLNAVRDSLRNPVLIDNSMVAEVGETNNNNIERTETFQVFFPDGTVSSTTGGQGDISQFQSMVQAATSSRFDLEFYCDLMKEAVCDFKDNNLVNACLLQFPYGRGGMQETRMKTDGSFTSSTDVAQYVEHLSYISQRHFHHELFSLVLYNMQVKQQMVRAAGYRVRDNLSANLLAEEITADDMCLSSFVSHLPAKKPSTK